MLSSVVIIGQGTLECKGARNPYTILVLEETPREMWANMFEYNIKLDIRE
jgi:hypothetical protein